MSKGFQWLPWYNGDFLRSTAGWSLLERAVYWQLLCCQWEIGHIPDDLARLAGIAGIDIGEMRIIWQLVGKRFVKTKAGLINRRMAEHRSNYLTFRKRQSEGGKQGMAKRWGKKQERSAEVIQLHPEKAP